MLQIYRPTLVINELQDFLDRTLYGFWKHEGNGRRAFIDVSCKFRVETTQRPADAAEKLSIIIGRELQGFCRGHSLKKLEFHKTVFDVRLRLPIRDDVEALSVLFYDAKPSVPRYLFGSGLKSRRHNHDVFYRMGKYAPKFC